MRLKSKITFVTGGSRGIGEAIVRRFAEEDATVVSGDIRKPTYDLPKGVEHIDLDVTTEVGWKSAVGHAAGKHGRIDNLVNNAGFATIEPLLEVTLESEVYLTSLTMRPTATLRPTFNGGVMMPTSALRMS
jgi:3-oxoacyl-[acyl-carrier protein] reductase